MKIKYKLIQPPKLTWEYIRNKAEEFRTKYIEPIFQIPVPVIDIVELKLRIHPIPLHGLRDRIDIDGFLTNDLKSIGLKVTPTNLQEGSWFQKKY